MYSLTRTFTNEAELFSFIQHMDKHSRQEMKKKTCDDKRGSHMGEFHKKAKIVKEDNPDMTYRQCMAIIKKEE